MTTEIKSKIVEQATNWMASKKLSQNELAKLAKINPAYLSNMLRLQLFLKVDDKEVEISDKWFYQLAAAIGFSVKKQYWSTIQTREFKSIIHELTIAKKSAKVTTIITESGMGKTYAVEKFCLVHPQFTHKVTVNSLTRVPDIIKELATKIGATHYYKHIDTLHAIGSRLRELSLSGHHTLIVIDEAENLKLPVIQMLKGLYDELYGYSSLVLIGTNQLTDLIFRLRRSNANGAPQFYRRIKAGIKHIQPGTDFEQFFSILKIEDKGLRKLLSTLCDNYGELHDYLEPALREADENEIPLTEEMFRIMYNIPKLI